MYLVGVGQEQFAGNSACGSENILQNMHVRGKSRAEFSGDSKKFPYEFFGPALIFNCFPGLRARWVSTGVRVPLIQSTFESIRVASRSS